MFNEYKPLNINQINGSTWKNLYFLAVSTSKLTCLGDKLKEHLKCLRVLSDYKLLEVYYMLSYIKVY